MRSLVFVRVRWWGVLGAATFAVAGFLFAASANVAGGTDLRSDTAALKDLVAEQAAVVDMRQTQLTETEERVAQMRDRDLDPRVQAAESAVNALNAPVGLAPLTGPSVTVALSDADPADNPEASPDDLVVHQQDLQAVINAMWRGGAQGIQVMDQRLINTSAVRCVGNTLILQGRVYSPPFVVTGIGEVDRLERELARDPYLRGYQAAVEFFGLGWEQTSSADLTIPGYEGPLGLDQATVVTDSGKKP